MWATDVLSGRYGFQSPPTLPGAWRSPSSSMSLFPELKTRMTEHWWLQNQDGGPLNVNFTGGGSQWTFNQGLNSTPATLYFDGHVSLLPMASCMAADAQVTKQQASTSLVEKGLWMRGTPFGTAGYFGDQAYDAEVDTSAHVLTTDGIRGRDTLRAR